MDAAPSGAVRTVLLIEDSELQRTVVARGLERHGYTVVTAADGSTGLRLLSEARPDIVLLDVVMPDPDGWRTLELIRAVSEVPVIMLTVLNAELERVRGLQGGADDYIGKPFGQLELQARIDAVLRRTSAARSDALTRLANHRAFHEHLDALLRRTPPGQREFALVLFDLDDFKRVNDTRGHPFGDSVLQEVAKVAVDQLRAGDEAFRIGGEEFAVLPHGDELVGVTVAERIRSALFAQAPGLRLPTISAGVSGFPRDGRTKEELVGKADRALYAAKRAGKNAVVLYDAHLEEGVTGRALGPAALIGAPVPGETDPQE